MIHNIFSKLADAAQSSELLQQHAAVLTRSGYRPVMPLNNYNHYTACRYSNDKPSIHAEKVALTKFRRHHQMRAANDAKIRRKLKRTSILVTRRNPQATADITDDTILFKSSAPCYHCIALLKDYGIRKVVFTDDYGEPQCKKVKSTRWRTYN